MAKWRQRAAFAGWLVAAALLVAFVGYAAHQEAAPPVVEPLTGPLDVAPVLPARPADAPMPPPDQAQVNAPSAASRKALAPPPSSPGAPPRESPSAKAQSKSGKEDPPAIAARARIDKIFAHVNSDWAALRVQNMESKWEAKWLGTEYSTDHKSARVAFDDDTDVFLSYDALRKTWSVERIDSPQTIFRV